MWSKVRPMPSINTYKCTVRINWLDLSSILLTTADFNCRYGEEFIVGNNWFIWSPDGHDNTDTSHFNARARLSALFYPIKQCISLSGKIKVIFIIIILEHLQFNNEIQIDILIDHMLKIICTCQCLDLDI